MSEPVKLPRGYHARKRGEANTVAVREYLIAHLGATNAECANATGLSVFAVGRHVQKLRAEWSTPPRPEGE